MNFVKKWISTIISFVAGVCGLALSACTGMVASGTLDASALGMGKETIDSTTKAFKVLTDGDLYTEAKAAGIGSEFMTMKVFAIITLVISVLLIVYAIVMLLKNLNVIKCESKIFDIVGISLFALLLIATIGLLISSNGYASAMEDAVISAAKASVPQQYLSQVKIDVNVKVGVYQPIMLAISIISALVVGTFTFLKLKKEA
ncbi:MAG: hypothetical protein IJ458_04295 [Clostridia bacterium]|nr:hypothetical protein [Clostridia bacterium]